jgi:Putative auto-transporter adhesin, head GIN domain
MKQLIIAALACLSGMGAKAQVTEVRKAQEATKLDVTNGIEVIITKNDTAALKIEAVDWETAQKVVTKYKGNTLKLYLENPNGITGLVAIRVYVSLKQFPEIKASAGAVIKADGQWEADKATIHLSTGATFSGDLKINGVCTISAASGSGFRGVVHAGTLKVNVMGGAFAKLIGAVNLADVYCSSGSLQGGKLVCEKAEITAQNASAVSIQAKQKIKADTDASSAITYYGSPAEAEVGENAYTIKRYTNRLSLN